MIRRITSLCAIIAIVCAGLVASSKPSHAANIAQGLAWLKAQQGPEGAWCVQTPTLVRPYQATAAVLDAFSAWETKDQAFEAGIAWLAANKSTATEELAWLLSHLDGADARFADTAYLLNTLASPDGWSALAGYQPETLDTALALTALNITGTCDIETAASSIRKITATQLVDGSWGFGDNAGNVFLTARVLDALTRYRTSLDVEAVITKAVAFLRTQSQGSGLIGESLYETALAYKALIQSGTNVLQDSPNTAVFLHGSQAADGSWDEDVYTTAVVLRALAFERPNLVASALHLSTTAPIEGEEIDITLSVSNQGPISATNVLVAIYDGDPSNGGQEIGHSRLPEISPYANTTFAVRWSTQGALGRHTIYGLVDPGSEVQESGETDNHAQAQVTVITLPDLAISNGDISITPQYPFTSDTISIVTTMRNLGEAASGLFEAALYLGSPQAGGTVIATSTVQTLEGGAETKITWEGNFLSGMQHLVVVIDHQAKVTELNEANNTATADLYVYPPASDIPDLTIPELTLLPPVPVAGEPVTVSCQVKNLGSLAAGAFRVELWDAAAGGGRTLKGSASISSVPAIGSVDISLPIQLTEGTHTLTMKADAAKAIAESNELNNEATAAVTVFPSGTNLPDLYTEPAEVFLQQFANNDPPVLVPSGEIILGAKVFNLGVASSPLSEARLYDNDPTNGGRLLGTAAVAPLSPGSSGYIEFRFNLVEGEYNLYLMLDQANTVTELDEMNNIFIKPIVVQVPKPELIAGVEDISFAPVQPVDGDLITVAVRIANQGVIDAANILARVYDGSPTEGVLLHEQVISSIAANSWATFTFTGAFAVGAHDIHLVMDPANTIDEYNERNNEIVNELHILTRPDLVVDIASTTITPQSPYSDEKLLIKTAIRNNGEAAASSVKVSFYDGNPTSGGTRLGDDFTIFKVHGMTSVSVDKQVFLSPGMHTIYILVDQGNVIQESDESNNAGTIPLNVEDRPDLYLVSGTLSVAPTNPVSGETIQASVVVGNAGSTAVGPVTVSFYNGRPECGGVPFGASQQIASLGGGAMERVSASGVLGGGYHELYVVVDTGNTIAEANEYNNSGWLAVTVPDSLPDVTIATGGVHYSPGVPISGSGVTVQADVRNIGATSLDGVTISYLDGPPPSGLLLGSQTLSLPANGTTTSQLTLTLNAGSHDLYAVVDTGNVVSEANEANNWQMVKVEVSEGVGYYDDCGSLTNEAHLIQGTVKQLTAIQSGYDAGVYTARSHTSAVKYTYAGLSANAGYRLTAIVVEESSERRIQQVQADGVALTANQEVPDQVPVTINVPIPRELTLDGSVTISFVGTSPGIGAIVSQLWLVKETGEREQAITRGLNYLDGNATYWNPYNASVGWGSGTAPYSVPRVLAAYRALGKTTDPKYQPILNRTISLQSPDGSWAGATPNTAHALIALVEAGVDPQSTVIQNGLNWLRTTVNTDHGWGSRKGMLSQPPYTGLVMLAFLVAGTSKTDPIIIDGASWLLAVQNGTGYWGWNVGDTDNPHIGPWPAIALYLATSPQDARVVKAIAKFKSIAPPNYRDAQSYLLRLMYYCGGTSQEITGAATTLKNAQQSNGSWIEAYLWYPQAFNQAQVLDALAKTGYGSEAWVLNGWNWLSSYVTAQGDPIDTLQEPTLADTSRVLLGNANAGALANQPILRKAEETLATYISKQTYFHMSGGNWSEPVLMALFSIKDSSYVPTRESSAVTAGVSAINGLQNTDGGWPDYMSNVSLPHRSAMALATLLKAGQPVTESHVVNGINYLLGKRGADGGWGNTSTTAWALLALHKEGLHPTQVAGAVAWLKATQNVDGGWGSVYGTSSTTEDTSLAIVALATTGESGEEIARGAFWLINTQNSDGGWGALFGDPASSNRSAAYATWALGMARFNLGIKLEVLFNKPWYYPSDLVSMVINPLNRAVGEVTVEGWVQSQTGVLANLSVHRTAGSFGAEYLIPGTELPGIDVANFVAASADAQGTATEGFVIRNPSGISPDLLIASGDITVSNPSPSVGETVTLGVTVSNAGLIDATNVVIRFYQGNPSSGGQQIGDLFIDRVSGLGNRTVSLDWIVTGGDPLLTVVVDPDNGIAELNEINNTATRTIYLNTHVPMPDLQVSADDLTWQPASPLVGDRVTATLTVHNQGDAEAGSCLVRFYDGAPLYGGQPLGEVFSLEVLPVGNTITVSATIDTTGYADRLYLHAVVDLENVVVESNETNNATFRLITLQSVSMPDLEVSPGSLTWSPASPVEGDTVQISAMVKNRGTAAVGVEASFYDGDPDAGGSRIGSVITLGSMGVGETRTISTSWNTLGNAGTHTIFAVVDPGAKVIEQREDNNRESGTVPVASSHFAISLSTPQSEYGANSEVPITVSMTNGNPAAVSAVLKVVVKDSASHLIAEVSQQTIDLPAQQTLPWSGAWNTGSTPDGNYTLQASLQVNGQAVAIASRAFSIRPDLSLNASVVTDKISYNPNETAKITWRVRNTSLNHTFTNLTATLTLTDSTGQILLTDTRPISSLTIGALTTLTTFWATETYPAGAYSLAVRVTTGTVLLAEAAGTLTIADTNDPAKLLSGTVAVDKPVIFSGDSENISYHITNIGNKDLAQLTIKTLIVGLDQQTIYAQFAEQIALDKEAVYDGGQTLVTTGFGAKDYLVALVAEIDGVSATLAGTWFRIQGAPGAPSVNAPANGSEVTTFTPTLVVNNASDPNELDTLTYTFELYADAGMNTLLSASDPMAEGTGTTSFVVPIVLAENTRYWWRCRAADAYANGPWMDLATFFVNTANEAPGAPRVDHPLDGAEVDAVQPKLTVKNAADPDGDTLSYNFLVMADDNQGAVVASATGIAETLGTTCWQVNVPLNDNTWYWWIAQADDWQLVGPWLEPVGFFVNTANDAPTAPVPFSPIGGVETGAEIVLVAANATDADGDTLSYRFQIDTDPSFASADLVVSGLQAEGAGRTSWTVPALLIENTVYYWRVQAFDGTTDGPWSEAATYFVNAVNEPPTTPVLLDPADRGEAGTVQPALTISNSADPDHDAISYDFEVYADGGLTIPVASGSGVAGGSDNRTSWLVNTSFTENTWYWWRCRATDGELFSTWATAASFMVNVANDPPGAPGLIAPAYEATVEVLQPELSVSAVADPEGNSVTYEFEVYADAGLTSPVVSSTGVLATGEIVTWVTPSLEDNRQYWWRSRAYDGALYSSWMSTATFTVHLPNQALTATINFDPDTLNLGSNGTWVTVYIELPTGYDPRNIDAATVLLQDVIPAVLHPVGYGDEDKDGIPDLMVKFKRSEVEAILPVGNQVVVRVKGMVGSIPFEGIDIIRVIQP